MRYRFATALLPMLVIAMACARGPSSPTQLHIRAGEVSAMIHLPDPHTGHYRGARFDWSGMIGELRVGSHVIWNEWNSSEDPIGHDDNAVGAAMEFGMHAPLGFDNAAPGEGFIKIGVGILRKPADDQPYAFGFRYDFIEPPAWTISSTRDSVTFRQSISHRGYGYTYIKRVIVSPQGMVIECDLANTGQRPISTEVYNHNFFRLSGRGLEPPLSIRFERPARFVSNAKGVDAFEIGDAIRVVTPLTRKSVWAPLEFDGDAAPRTFVIRNDELAVTVEHDLPIARHVLYGRPEFISVEPFIVLSIPPGDRARWSYRYTLHRTGAERPLD
ncbi:hypothetical protein QQ054_04610 [Oscillatoria amoena NRMC-F 0135]|nr:hypothetical protein [Oscillatoria amoena NRMC-F 0135]